MSTTETSVALSLAELTRIEEGRIERERNEQAQRVAERARLAGEAQERIAAESEAKARAEVEAGDRRAAELAAERARVEARERVAAEVARIEAEARVRLEADNAARSHELAELRLRRESGRRRRELVMGVALALSVAAGGLGLWSASSRSTDQARATQELREREHSLVRERDDAKRSELGALERRHAALSAKSRAAEAKTERATADAARAAIDARSPSHAGLRAFAEALDAFEAKLETQDELALLDQRRADLTAWATSARRTRELGSVAAAAKAARAPDAGRSAVAAYSRALDRLGLELAERTLDGGRPGTGASGTAHGTCQEGDPGCGLDGKPLF